MSQDEPELLALQAAYGNLYNEFIRPEQKYTISHYLRTQWAPLLGAARLWFIVALRQRCFWNERQEWCIVDKKTLAHESGLSPRTINRIVAADGETDTEDRRDAWAAWFFDKKRRRRYDQQVGRTVNAPNRYHVLLDDPLTPQHQAGLAHYLRQHTAGGGAPETLQALEALCALSDEARRALLEAAPPGADPHIPAAFVLDVVEACCPVPDSGPVRVDIARAALQLHQAITRPDRVYIGTQYFRRQWLPRLGPLSALLVVNLRARCYWNEHTGELRDTCRASWTELAAEVGCTDRQLRNLRQDETLQRFVTVTGEGHGAARSTFGVQVLDLLTDEDTARFEQRLVQWAQAQPAFEIDPESGQMDALPLLLQAQAAVGVAPPRLLPEILAPGSPAQAAGQEPGGQAEILAHGGIGPRIKSDAGPCSQEGHAEVLAHGEMRTAGRAIETAETPHEDARQSEVLAFGSAGQDLNWAAGMNRRDGQAETWAPGTAAHAEILAPGTEGLAEILASGERKFWHIEGLQAEILASEGGNFGTTRKLLFITFNLKGLSTAALELSDPLCQDPERLAAAVRRLVLAELDIQEPNRSRIAQRRPPCCQIVAWGLYALTQRGLQNRAGYIYNRLSAGDAAPQDMVDLACLPPPVWRAFVSAVQERKEYLLPDTMYATFRQWWAVFKPIWSEITFHIDPLPSGLEDLSIPVMASDPLAPCHGETLTPFCHCEERSDEAISNVNQKTPLPSRDGVPEERNKFPSRSKATKQSPTRIQGTEDGHEAPPLQHLPEIGALLDPDETAQWDGEQWLLITPSLARACRLYQQLTESSPGLAARIGVPGSEGQIHLAKAGILSIAAEPLPGEQWAEIVEGLRLRMGHKAFERWWPEVQPLGLTGGLGHDAPSLLLGVPGPELCGYLSQHHTEVAVWTCTSVLHHPLQVLFLAYSEGTLQPEPAPAPA